MSNFRYYKPNNFPPIVKNLIIINVLVWVAQLIFDKQYNFTGKLALYPIGTPEFKPYQIATPKTIKKIINPLKKGSPRLFISAAVA